MLAVRNHLATGNVHLPFPSTRANALLREDQAALLECRGGQSPVPGHLVTPLPKQSDYPDILPSSGPSSPWRYVCGVTVCVCMSLTFLLFPGSQSCSGWRPSPGPEEAPGLQTAFPGLSGWTPQALPHFTFPFWPLLNALPFLCVFSLGGGSGLETWFTPLPSLPLKDKSYQG